MEAKIKVKDWDIGPAHDPYSASLIEIRKGNITCESYNDGLGTDWVQVLQGDVVIVRREWNWFKTSPQQRKNNNLYANLLARRYSGMTFDEAEGKYYDMYNPMPSSHYM